MPTQLTAGDIDSLGNLLDLAVTISLGGMDANPGWLDELSRLGYPNDSSTLRQILIRLHAGGVLHRRVVELEQEASP